MRAILLNPFDQTVKEVVYTGDFREIYSLIDCTTFDVVRLSESDDMYVDDEGNSMSTTYDLQEVIDKVEWLPEGHRETPYMEFKAWK